MRRRPGIQPVEHIFVVGNAVGGVGDGRGQQLVNRLGAVALGQGKEGVNHAGQGEGQVRLRMPRPGGDALQPLRLVEGGGGLARRRALPAQRQQFAGVGVVEHEHALGGQGVGRNRLHHGGGEPGGHQRVEGVAAREQHPHTGHGSQVVAAGNHAFGGAYHRAAGGSLGDVALFGVYRRLLADHIGS